MSVDVVRDACWAKVAAECPLGHGVAAHREGATPRVHVRLFGAGLAAAYETAAKSARSGDPGALQCLPGSEVYGYPGRFRPDGEIAPWTMKSWIYLEAENAGR